MMSVCDVDYSDEQRLLQRVLIIGTSAAGKSTLASQLASLLGIPHVELDSLHWGERWTPVEVSIFRERVLAATSKDRWIIDGNYSAVRDLIWPNATRIIWLDYPFYLVLWRSIRRTITRVIKGEPCCNGNRETLRIALSRDSVIWWVITTFHRRRREFAELLPSFENKDQGVMVFRNPRETERWLQRLVSDFSAVNHASLHAGSVESS